MSLGQYVETGLLLTVVLPWIAGLSAGFIALWMWFRRVAPFKEKPIAAAHQVVVFAPFLYLAITGTYMWFWDAEFAEAFKEDKIYGSYLPCQKIVSVMLAFQIWDLCSTSLMAKEVKGQAQHMAHHAASTLVCCIALVNGPHGFQMYYGAFFFGISEISSIPLAAMDLFKYSRELTAKYPKVNEAVRVTFAVLFLLLRCIYWPVVSVDFWVSTLSSSAPLWLQMVWYFFNIALTLLQFYWGSLIVKGIIKMIKGGGSNQARETGEALYPEAVEVSQSSA